MQDDLHDWSAPPANDAFPWENVLTSAGFWIVVGLIVIWAAVSWWRSKHPRS